MVTNEKKSGVRGNINIFSKKFNWLHFMFILEFKLGNLVLKLKLDLLWEI
jgi:hypothetical protein